MKENEAFALWQSAQTEEEKRAALDLLIPLLRRHAFAVCWLKLGEYRPDIVADAVWKAIDKAHTFRGESLFSTWFQAIVTQMCNLSLREKITHPEISVDTLEETLGDEERQGRAMLAKAELEQAMEVLDDEEKLVVRMRLEGLTHEEIGERLGITVGGACKKWFDIAEKMRRGRES